MKRYTLLYIAMMTVFGLASCDLETSDNDKLDGFWKLHAVDTLSTNGQRDMTNDGIFWSIQMKLLNVRDTKCNNEGYLFRFKHTGDSLIVSNPYVKNREIGDSAITDVTQLHPFGIHEITERFYIETLKSDQMTLQSRRLRLYFKKF